MLKILQDGKTIKIPSNLGITSRCMHPLHTHDETGLIHMEYPRNVKYTLGDFFDLMGVVLKDDQVGSLRVLDDYSITIMKNNQKIMHGYYKILLKDHDKITITIISP